MCSKRMIDAPDSDARDAITRAAVRQFAKNGVETTMRDIVEEAGISLGAINYHFGSKLGLAYEVYEDVAWRACEQRRLAYEALEAEADGGPVPADKIFRALIKPYLEGDEDRRKLLIYILQQQRLAKLKLARDLGIKHFDQIARKTIAMLRKSYPHLTARDVAWRYNLALAAVVWVVSDCGPDNRLKIISDGEADAADREQLMKYTIDFIVGAFERGSAP